MYIRFTSRMAFSQSLAHCFFYKVPQTVGKAFYNGLVDPVFMGHNAFAAEPVVHAIRFRARAKGVYVISNRTINPFFSHQRYLQSKRYVIND